MIDIIIAPIIILPFMLLVIGMYITRFVKGVYGAISDARAYLKERKELKWM